MRLAAACAALAALAAPAAAALAEKACFVAYSGFEEKVPHLDIDTCPTTRVKPDEGFCRIALDGQAVLVYTFRHTDPEPCLVRVDRMDFNEFAERFGATYDKP